jgi:hypothetical protein
MKAFVLLLLSSIIPAALSVPADGSNSLYEYSGTAAGNGYIESRGCESLAAGGAVITSTMVRNILPDISPWLPRYLN